MSREIELVREHLNNDVATRKEIVVAAKELGISERTLYRKIKQYDIKL